MVNEGKQNLSYLLQFDKLCNMYHLGKQICEPRQIFGGHLHRMYAIETDRGKFAIKALNPQVMQRIEAKQNILNSEYIAQIAAKSIPVAFAKRFGNTIILEIDGQYYLVFDWIDGKSLFHKEISKAKCEEMGALLARIHQIDFSDLGLKDDYSMDEKLTDWNYYLNKGKEMDKHIASNALWLDLFETTIEHLENWNTRLVLATKELALDSVISHGDLEPKNVMWHNDNPMIIDWEAAGYINPMHDLIETALYWSLGENDMIEKEKFCAFVNGYKGIHGKLIANWLVVLEKGFSSKLGWLEYSLKRTLGIECADEAEQQMGKEHVIGTIKMLFEYEDMIDKIIKWLED